MYLKKKQKKKKKKKKNSVDPYQMPHIAVFDPGLHLFFKSVDLRGYGIVDTFLKMDYDI